MFLRCLAVTLVLLVTCRLTMAQEIKPAPGSKELPDRVKLQRNGDPIPVWLAHAGCKPLAEPKESAQPLTPSRPTRFLELFYFADSVQPDKDGPGYHLLVRADEEGKKVKEYVGWVDSRHLIVRNEARKDPATQMYLKGFIVNSLDFLKSVKEGKGDLSKLEILNAPRADAPGRDEPLRLYNILFIYNETEDYILLGGAPSFSLIPGKLGEDKETEQLPPGERDARRVVLGWLPKERICRWNTREGFEWDHESTLPGAKRRRQSVGKIYETEAKAREALTDTSIPAIFEEELDKSSISPQKKFYEPRFPILARVDKEHPTRGQLLHVGGIGGLHGADGKLVMSSAEVSKYQRQLDRIRQQIKRTEILFVIDDTGSMKEWFDEVAGICDEIMKTVREDPQRDVHIAIAYYRDDRPPRPDAPAVTVTPLRDVKTHGAALVAELRKHVNQAGGGGDPLEMVFRGMVEGLEQAGFKEEAHKIVVLLGDCGDISASEDRRKADPNYLRRYNEREIVKRLLKDNQSPVNFFAIQVVNPADSEDYAAFQKQAESLVNAYRQELKSTGDTATAEYFTPKTRLTVRQKILRRYQELDTLARDLDERIKRLGYGQFRTTVITPELQRILERNGINVERLKQIDGFQVFQYGYVWTKALDLQPQINVRVLLNDKEMLDLVQMLEVVQREKDNPGTGKDPLVRRVLRTVVSSQAGDRELDPKDLGGQTVASLNSYSRGLMFRNSLLVKRIDELEDDPFTLTEFFYLLKAKMILEDIRKDQEHSYEPEKIDFTGKKVTRWNRKGDTRSVQRGFLMPGDRMLRWYWLDYRKEWP